MRRITPSDMALSRTETAPDGIRGPHWKESTFLSRVPAGEPEPDLFRVKFQGRRINAVPQSVGRGAILEHMAEMTVAFRAQHFGANHAVTDVPCLIDVP